MDQRLYDAVRDGALDLEVVLAQARTLIQSEDGREALFSGSREWLLAQLRSESPSADLTAEIHRTIARIGTLSRGLSVALELDPFAELATRMDALAALASDMAAFEENYSVEGLRHQPHFAAGLEILYRADERKMGRTEMLATLGLKEANGTRVLKALEKARLINRRKAGRNIMVELSKLGEKVATAWRSPPANLQPVVRPMLSVKEGPLPGMHNGSWSAASLRLAAVR